HGLATAYYLASMHGITDVAVLERGWIGGGNTGRNTTIVRSNYGQPANSAFYEHSLKLWEGLSDELNFNVMLSQRGLINTFHTAADREAWIRRYNFMRLRGIDAELLSREDLAERVPAMNLSTDLRLPVLRAVLQPRAGVADLGLSDELNFNVMLSQRGLINTFHTAADREAWIRRYNFMRLRGIDAELLSREDLAERVPAMNLSTDLRLPVLGAVLQPRAGVAHHDAVAWGYGRAAAAKGVGVSQNCEVTGFARE